MTMLALPSTREEAWRWSDLSGLPALAGAPHCARRRPAALPWLDAGVRGKDEPEASRLLFIDGVFQPEDSNPGPLTIGPVGASAHGHPLGMLAEGQGWSLALGPDHATPGRVEIIHVATGGANHLSGRIVLAADAQASIVETFIGDGWANRLTEIVLGKSARLMRAVRLAQTSGFTSLRDQANIGEGASLDSIVLGASQAGSRIDAALTLRGDGAFAEMSGALLARGEQRHDVHVVVRHAEPGGTSRQVWRAVTDDAATASVAARVEVARHAQQTDGEQSLRGLLMKRGATINLKPELEIFADDVKCAHGATVGELDPAALFYLASRGVPPVEARSLLTHAFIADALGRIGEEPVREAFIAEADAWLGAAA